MLAAMLSLLLALSVQTADAHRRHYHVGRPPPLQPTYHYSDAGTVWLWILLFAVGVFFCLFAFGGAWHWHSTRHVYKHGTRTFVDADGKTRVEKIDEHTDTVWPDEGEVLSTTARPGTQQTRARQRLVYNV